MPITQSLKDLGIASLLLPSEPLTFAHIALLIVSLSPS
jgi:hypothetical protein